MCDSDKSRENLLAELETLRAFEARHRNLFELARDPIFTVRPPEGFVIETNAAAESMLGYTKSELANLVGVDLIAPEVLDETNQSWISQVEKTGEFLLETLWVHKDGTRIPVSVSGKPIKLNGVPHFHLMGRDLRLIKKEESRRAELETQLHLFKLDIHDGLAQDLTVISLWASNIEVQIEQGSTLVNKNIAQLVNLVNGAKRTTHSLAQGISPVDLKKGGLRAALEELVAWNNRLHDSTCTFQSTGNFEPLQLDKATHLYRICQEAISNAIHHGQAKQVAIRLEMSADNFQLIIEDDGVGLHINSHESEGLGLQGMRTRARLLGGLLDIQNRDEGGTRIVCSIPFKSLKSQPDQKSD